MPQTIIRFKGRVTWEGQSNGLPKLVYAFLIFPNGAQKERIQEAIEVQMRLFARDQMMYVQRDQGAVIDINAAIHDRMGIPFHNLAFILPELHSVAGEISVPDDEGVERTEDGKEPTRQ